VVTALLLCGTFALSPVGAQVAGGILSGTISDPSGAGVSLARVIVKNIATDRDRFQY
jgi:hypothetical protein